MILMKTNIGTAPIRRADVTAEEHKKIKNKTKHNTITTNTITNNKALTQGTRHITFAASSVTKAEEKTAKRGHTDGPKPINVPKRIWRTQVGSQYHDEETT
jgi:hydroxyacyl-ACP dehydratase HTD2-like protein with hotdog domain